MEGQKKGLSEDWLSLWLGLAVFLLGLGLFLGWDILGWVTKTNVWTDLSKAIAPVSKVYKDLPSLISLFFMYLFFLFIMLIGAVALGARVEKFLLGFTLVFWISYLCYLGGHYAYIAATPDKLKSLGITWSLNLTGEAGYIFALLAGLIVGNFFPRFAEILKEATRPELYIKTAIVIMGAGLGAKAAENLGLGSAIIFRGLCASIEDRKSVV